MSKKILNGEDIYVAPQMLGSYQNGVPVVLDERTGKDLDPTAYLDKVAIYEREVVGWFLEPARRMLDEDSSSNSFIVIMICMSYIEGVEQYKQGKSSNRRSKEFFISSLNRIFPDKFQDGELGSLYSKTRCGLFHNGMVQGGVLFNNDKYNEPLTVHHEGSSVEINPRLLLCTLEKDFQIYIESLKCCEVRDQSEGVDVLKENFEKTFNIL